MSTIITDIARELYRQHSTLDIWDKLAPNEQFRYYEQAEQLIQAIEKAGYTVLKKAVK